MPSSQPAGPHITIASPKAAKPLASESKPLEPKAAESKPSDSNVPKPVEPEAKAPEAKSFKEALVDGVGASDGRTDSSNSTSPSSSQSNSTRDSSTNTSRSNSNSNPQSAKAESDKDTEKVTKESNERGEQRQEKDTADIPVVSKHCTVTSERLPAVNVSIDKSGVARCNVVEGAISDAPMKDFHELEQTPMQQHILFWDRDRDGQIYPYDTYRGFRDLGFNILFSFLAMLIINLNFSYPTRLAYSFFPDPRFRVYVDSIYKAKHGSDSGSFDAEGRFVPQHFEDMFAKYDGDQDGALTFGELFNMMHGNRCAADPFGWGAAFFEWVTTWLLIQKDGKVYKDDLLGVYDGSLFWKIAKARKSREGWSQGFGLGGDGFLGGVKVI